MAKRTKAEMLTYIKLDFKRTDMDATILSKLNDTIRWMATNHTFTELDKSCYTALVTGQPEYALPSGILQLRHPIILLEESGDGRSGSGPLDHISWDQYLGLEPNAKTSQTPPKGKPYAYAIHMNAVWLTSIPDSVARRLEVHYNRLPDLLAGDSDLHPFLETDEELLKAGTLERLYRDVLKLHEESDEQALNFFYGYYNAGTGERTGGWKNRVKIDTNKTEPMRAVRPTYF